MCRPFADIRYVDRVAAKPPLGFMQSHVSETIRPTRLNATTSFCVSMVTGPLVQRAAAVEGIVAGSTAQERSRRYRLDIGAKNSTGLLRGGSMSLALARRARC